MISRLVLTLLFLLPFLASSVEIWEVDNFLTAKISELNVHEKGENCKREIIELDEVHQL